MHAGTVEASVLVFFFNDTATTEIYTLSLHDALPISVESTAAAVLGVAAGFGIFFLLRAPVAGIPFLGEDRKSTRLNSSHANISYAVFCLKKKKGLSGRHCRPPAHGRIR